MSHAQGGGVAGGKAGLTNPFLCLAVHPRPGQDGAQAGETPIPTSEPSLDPHSTASWKGALQTFTSSPALCLQPWKPLSKFRKVLRAWFSLLQDTDFLCDSGIVLLLCSQNPGAPNHQLHFPFSPHSAPRSILHSFFPLHIPQVFML